MYAFKVNIAAKTSVISGKLLIIAQRKRRERIKLENEIENIRYLRQQFGEKIPRLQEY